MSVPTPIIELRKKEENPMIEYSSDTDYKTERDIMYFAGDGSWGPADDVVIVDVTELDGHFGEFVDELSDWELPDFMRWYVENQTHDQISNDNTACRVCTRWEEGTEKEILEELENEDA
jgi:hypothetical protein